MSVQHECLIKLSLPYQAMNQNSTDIAMELLQDDILSRGFLVQSVNWQGMTGIKDVSSLRSLLQRLLESDRIEIGETIARDNYVEFVGWKGSVAERIEHAVCAVNKASDIDREFAYWLCLRENVDRFE